MAWTTPTIRSTGDLITASIWNTDLVDNLAYLKGEAGVDIALEEDVVPSAGTERVGLSTNPWNEGHYSKLFAGPRTALHKFIREVTLAWEDDSSANYSIQTPTTGSGTFSMGGFGQAVMEVANNGIGDVYVRGIAEQNNALDNSFNASRSPYLRQEFAIDRNVADVGAFLGFRTTPGTGRPIAASEKYAGLIWTGAIWVFECGDGAGNSDTSGTQTINVDTRYVIEILIVSATKVEVYLNGVLIDTFTTGLPTGDLEWSCLLETDGLGGATSTYLTLGKPILQEDLS